MYSSGTERYTNKHIPRVDNPNMRDQKVLYNLDKTILTLVLSVYSAGTCAPVRAV